jgi:hypothetical protein
MLSIISLLVPGIAIGQECPTALSMQCSQYADKLAAGACLKPGSIFVLKDKWEQAARAKISFNGQKDVRFFYVVDGKNISTKYDVLFVSIDRVGQQTAHADVKLTQNQALKFKTTEDKQKYSRALKSDGQPTQPMRQWSYFSDFGNVFLLKTKTVIADFDIPQAIGDTKHAPHARLYRYETGNISCIPFGAELNSDVDLILGKIIDTSAQPTRTTFFRISIE